MVFRISETAFPFTENTFTHKCPKTMRTDLGNDISQLVCIFYNFTSSDEFSGLNYSEKSCDKYFKEEINYKCKLEYSRIGKYSIAF